MQKHAAAVDADAHRVEMKLLDLPILLLSTIAAFVSCSQPDEITYEGPLQVTCGQYEWRALNGMRSSCRALREATRLAVAGLRNIDIAAPEGARSHEMPFLTAKGLPMLAKLDNLKGPGLAKLMQELPKALTEFGLAEVGCRGCYHGNARICCYTPVVLNHSSTLESVTLSGVCRATVRSLLASLSGRMKILCLTSYEGPKTSPLSREAAMTIESATFDGCRAIDSLLLQLLESARLSSLSFRFCSFTDPGTLRHLSRAVNLRRVSYYCSSYENGYNFEKALGQGALQSLEELEYVAIELDVDKSEEARMITFMLAGVRQGLRKLDLTLLRYALDETLISPIMNTLAPGLSDCEIMLNLYGSKYYGANHPQRIPDSMFGPVRDKLVSLAFKNIHVSNLAALSHFPNLRTIKFEYCVLPKGDVIEMARAARYLISLRIWKCRHAEEVEGREPLVMMTSTSGSARINLKEARQGQIILVQGHAY